MQLKSLGNVHFRERNCLKALECYTKVNSSLLLLFSILTSSSAGHIAGTLQHPRSATLPGEQFGAIEGVSTFQT